MRIYKYNECFLHWIDVNKLDMRIISGHPEAFPFLEANPHLICWDEFSANSPDITFLTANLDKVNWTYLSKNGACVPLLMANRDKIDWYTFCLFNVFFLIYFVYYIFSFLILQSFYLLF